MPNWCKTTYKVTGKKENVDFLAFTLMGLHKERKHDLADLVKEMGGDASEISCRGEWSFEDEDFPVYEGVLSFETMTAWCEMADWRHFVEERFSVKIYFLAEEFGLLLFETNDRQKKFFSDEYFFFVGTDDRPEDEYYETLDALIKAVEQVTCRNGLNSFEECQKALDDMATADPSFWFTLLRVSYVD